MAITNNDLEAARQWPDFYALLEIEPESDANALRRSITDLYLKASQNYDHREIKRRFYFQVLSQRILPQCRHILLNPPLRDAYDAQWHLHKQSASDALSYPKFVDQLIKAHPQFDASQLALAEEEIEMLPTLQRAPATEAPEEEAPLEESPAPEVAAAFVSGDADTDSLSISEPTSDVATPDAAMPLQNDPQIAAPKAKKPPYAVLGVVGLLLVGGAAMLLKQPKSLTTSGGNKINIAFRNADTGIWTISHAAKGSGAPAADQKDSTFTYPWAEGKQFQSFTGDFNGDGSTDLGLRDASDGEWRFSARAKDADKFSSDDIPRTAWVKGTHYEPFIGDFNNDNTTDIGMRDPVNGSWYFRMADNSFSYPDQIIFKWKPGKQLQPFTADFNEDGLPDIGLRDAETGEIQLALAKPNCVFVPQPVSLKSAAGKNYQIMAGDFNGDGRGDIALRNSDDGVISIINGKGAAGGFGTEEKVSLTSGANLSANLIGDR